MSRAWLCGKIRTIHYWEGSIPMLLDYLRGHKQQQFCVTFYLTIYAIFLVMDFLDTTMFKISWPGSIQIILMELLLIFTAIKYLSQDKSSKRENGCTYYWLRASLAQPFFRNIFFYLFHYFSSLVPRTSLLENLYRFIALLQEPLWS